MELRSLDIDSIDHGILDLLQENCKLPLTAIGEKVGLSASSVLERIHKLEEAGVIQGYAAILDGRKLGKDITAFIGVSLAHPTHIAAFQRDLVLRDDVLESHHVTGQHTLVLKVKCRNTAALEALIDQVRSAEGVTRTETMVALSTQRETLRLSIDADAISPDGHRRGRRTARRTAEMG